MHFASILEKKNLTQQRLREIFTDRTDSENGCIRKRIEERIQSQVQDGVCRAAKNATLYQAVDMAWDAPPIHKDTIPLLLWAEGKITNSSALLERVQNPELKKSLTRKNKDGTVVINLPRLYEISISLIRSYVTRRLAAQTARFANLWPYFRYEPRGVDAATKLKADALSQRVDIMVDQYNMRHFGTQCVRDMLLYAYSLIFPRSAWDKQTKWRPKQNTEDEVESYTYKEGIDFVNPHPTRQYWDLSAPLANVNTDNGPRFVGYWDIVRFGSLSAQYWNLDCVSYGSNISDLITSYADFFNYYFDPKIITAMGPSTDPSLANSRTANIGVYASCDKDQGCMIGQHFMLLNPKHEGICDYDCEIWIRFTFAGDGTVIGAEPMPSIPACYGGMNVNDSRVVNASMAMELLPYQDQLSNIASQMLMNIRSSMVQLWLLDKDSLEEESLKYFKDGAEQKDFFIEPRMLIYSSSKLKDLGINDPTKAFAIIQANTTQTIETSFNAITRLLNLADRLMILSPNELGQPAPREISALEVQTIANTTESISTFIADGIDEQRAAQKKLCFESLVTHSVSTFVVPAMRRYNKETIKAAGFEVVSKLETGQIIPANTPISGNTKVLIMAYIYDSRDGAERTPNTAVADTITKLVQFLTSNETVAVAMGKRRLIELINEAVRLSGAGVDFSLSLDEGESEEMGIKDLEAIVAKLEQRLAAIENANGLAPAAPADGGQMPIGVPPQEPMPTQGIPDGGAILALGGN